MGYILNFSSHEFACPCCGSCNMQQSLLVRLQALREIFGRPLTINSGFRCPEHNEKVGGSPGSQHLLGRAADISTAHMTGDQKQRLSDLVERLEFGGFGKYPTFIHIDVRPGAKIRWVN